MPSLRRPPSDAASAVPDGAAWLAARGPALRRRRWRLVLARRQRLLVAALLAAAAGVAVDAASPPEPGRAILVADRDVPAGHALRADDLGVRRLPAHLVPDGALPPGAVPDGATLAGALRRGEVLTDVRLVGAGLLTGQPGHLVLAAVRLADPAVLDAVRPGDRVDVLASSTGELDLLDAPATAVAESALVLAVPHEGGSPTAALLGGSAPGGVVVLALERQEAERVAGATGALTAVLRAQAGQG